MQTFRLCENVLDTKDGFSATCAAPAIDAVKVLAPSASTGLSAEAPGASRGVIFGGGHLHLRYNMAIVNHDDCPCSHAMHLVAALVVLPLLEDENTPAYLPALTVSRTFNSVVASTQSDNDENILWWSDNQLDLTNMACFNGLQGACPIRALGSQCANTADLPGSHVGALLEAHAGALYGRWTIDHHVRVKRRLREREALFLVTEWFSNLGNAFGDCPEWPFRVNAYMRYAVRPLR